MQDRTPIEPPVSPVPGVIPDVARVHRPPQTWMGGPVGAAAGRVGWLRRKPGRQGRSTTARPKGR